MMRQARCRHPGPAAAARSGCARAWTPTPILTDPTAAPKKIKNNGTRGVDISGATDKQGSRLVRWAAVEAVQRVPAHTRFGQRRDRVAARRGRNIGVVAAARDLITLVFYGLRDHHIRCLSPRTETA